ncbi:hypothetical protein RSAG8_09630, partial [Rhizoctonia solani AG-8 WAC10335]
IRWPLDDRDVGTQDFVLIRNEITVQPSRINQRAGGGTHLRASPESLRYIFQRGW